MPKKSKSKKGGCSYGGSLLSSQMGSPLFPRPPSLSQEKKNRGKKK